MRGNSVSGKDYAMFALAIGLLAAQTLLDAWCIGWYYYWFGVSEFGLPPMNFLTTAGIVLGLRFAINGFGDDGRTELTDMSSEVLITRIVFVPVGLWIVGFILSVFAG